MAPIRGFPSLSGFRLSCASGFADIGEEDGFAIQTADELRARFVQIFAYPTAQRDHQRGMMRSFFPLPWRIVAVAC